MTCDVFKQSESLSTNNIKSIFAKLLLSDAPGNILYNQYVQLAEDIEYPIKTLNELEISFFSPDGSLFDFNGVEHSFTLEFYEKTTYVKGTKINVKDGGIDIIKRFNMHAFVPVNRATCSRGACPKLSKVPMLLN